MHNSSKGKLKHQIKRKDETVIGRLRKYIVRSRGNTYQHLRVLIKNDPALRSRIKENIKNEIVGSNRLAVGLMNSCGPYSKVY